MVVLGPFFNETSYPDFEELKLRHTGFSVEFTRGPAQFSLPIYQECRFWQDDRVYLRDLFVWIEGDAWPFAFDCRNFQVRESLAGPFVQLDAFLHGVFSELGPKVGFREIVAELLSLFRWPIPEVLPAETKIVLNQRLSQNGFRMGHIRPSVSSLYVEFVCSLILADGCEFPIRATAAEFRPKQGRLGDGKWMPSMLQESVEALVWEDFKRHFDGSPREALLDAKQEALLLEHFEWSNVTLMSAQELVEARRQLVQQCPPSMEEKEVAALLQKQRLYSDYTSLSQIRRMVAKLRRTGGD